MVAHLKDYYSHPNKLLSTHIHGVVQKVSSVTNLKIAEIAAIFHDIGKLNPYFQDKLNPQHDVHKYSNHSYLSAFSFLCYCTNNDSDLLKSIGNKAESLASILAIIAHHHGDLPDLPIILHDAEYQNLLDFLSQNPCLPVSEFLSQFISHKNFTVINHTHKSYFKEELQLKLAKNLPNPLDFFLETQFAFASLIYADKSDASGYEKDTNLINEFCSNYQSDLSEYVNSFTSTSELDNIRTQMRLDALKAIIPALSAGKRLFSLTAPTGSGKTIMLLSLAEEILKQHGNLRIIYALPFLSITEQVESICQKIFNKSTKYIWRIDSKTENLDFSNYQKILDNDPTALQKVLSDQFSEDTFDFPFIITTFVRLFETLMSNKNATLLKLVNFSNTIFLIDEIQALPPRLYGFFVAFLDAFCKKFNSYAIISTATMPNFTLPLNNRHNLRDFFNGYTEPVELLSFEYFNKHVFNRYTIEILKDSIEIQQLASLLQDETKSVLVILSTIQDTIDLFNIINDGKNNSIKVVLLNTHFTPHDRIKKISFCKEALENNKRVILISTQLIEAGVDIDFPVVYRDICPIPSLIQSAGRCNRNGKYIEKGKMIIFNLYKNNHSRSSCIYRGKDTTFLNITKESLKEKKYHELSLQNELKTFFNFIKDNTLFGTHFDGCFNNCEIDFIDQIKKAKFKEIGKFQLIDNKTFGTEKRYYIPIDKDNNCFEILENIYEELTQTAIKDFEKRKINYIRLNNHIKSMSSYIVQIRFKSSDALPPHSKECCGLTKLSTEYYNKHTTGIQLSIGNQIL